MLPYLDFYLFGGYVGVMWKKNVKITFSRKSQVENMIKFLEPVLLEFYGDSYCTYSILKQITYEVTKLKGSIWCYCTYILMQKKSIIIERQCSL